MPQPGYPLRTGHTPPDQRSNNDHLGGAFAKVRKPNGLVCCPPPSCHFLALCTGGLGNLFREISTNSQPPLHDFGAFTTEKGRFRPTPDMPLLALRYRFAKVIAEGQSCVVVKALDTFKKSSHVSIKILHLNYCKLGTQEVDVIRQLNQADPYRFSGVLRLQNTFMFDDHFCMVFDYYDPKALLEHMKPSSNMDKLEFIRKVAARLILCLGFLQSQNVIHADLKIENILLADPNDPNSVRLVDFGNAIHCVHNEMSLYYQDFELQTLLYRAPEVMYGLPFGTEIDMWSLGTVLAQLFIGRPFVLGKSKQAITTDTVKTLGPLPRKIFQRGKFYQTLEQFTEDSAQPDPVYRLMTKLCSTDYHFCDFLAGLLQYDPKRRLTPNQAASHPFLAPILGFGHLGGRYSLVPVSNQSYPYSPSIQDEIKRQHLSSLDLLREGTSVRPKLQSPASLPSQTTNLKHDRLELLRNRQRSTSGHAVPAETRSLAMDVSEPARSAEVRASTSHSEMGVDNISSVSNTSQASSSEYGYVSSPDSGASTSSQLVKTGHDRTPEQHREETELTSHLAGMHRSLKKRDENFNLKSRPSPRVDNASGSKPPKRSAEKAALSYEPMRGTPKVSRQRPETPRFNTAERDEIQRSLSKRAKSEIEPRFQVNMDARNRRAGKEYVNDSDQDSDDTALLSPESSASSFKPVETMTQPTGQPPRTPSSTSVRSGPASARPSPHQSKPPVSNQSRPKPKTQRALLAAPVAESLISGIVRSTPMVKSSEKRRQLLDPNLPNFGNISPIDSKSKFQLPSGRCKKTLPFHGATSDSKTAKRKRSIGAQKTDDRNKRRVGNKTQLLYEVFGEDVYTFYESPKK